MHFWNNFEGAETPVAVGQGSCQEDLAPRLAHSGFPGAQYGMFSLQASCGKEELAWLQSKRLINKMRDQISKGSVSSLDLFLIYLSLNVSRGSVMCYISINPCKSVRCGNMPSSVTETSACPDGREGVLGHVTWIRCLKSDLLSSNLLLFLIFMCMSPESSDPVFLIKDCNLKECVNKI